MRSNAWPERLLAVLVACSLEAAWLELAYVTVQGLTRAVVAIPIAVFFVAALAGLAVGRWAAQHPGVPYRAVLGTLVLGASVLGWLVPLGGAVDPLGAPVASLEAHLAGLLLGVAVYRGAAHAAMGDEEAIATRALGPGAAGVAMLWLLLVASGAARLPWILDAAFAATVTFVTAGLLALGLARLSDQRFERTPGAGRRTWTGLLVGVVTVLLLLAVPLALVVGAPAEAAVRGVLGPVGDVVVAILALAILPLGLLGALLVNILTFLRDTLDLGRPGAVIGQLADEARRVLGGNAGDGPPVGIVPLVLVAIAGLLVLRRLLERPEPLVLDGAVTETRQSEVPLPRVAFRRPRLNRPRRRRGDPRTASEAYLASLELVAGSPATRRQATETPAEHARRLCDDALGAPMGRLAADYALAEFAGRPLRGSEHRRAVARWRRVRELVERPRRAT